MLLSAKLLNSVANVNTFEYVDQLPFTEGDAPLDIYLQITDLSKDRLVQGFKPSGRRYIPAVGALLQVTIQNIDQSKTIVKSATQPFAGDTSIWKIQLLTTDPVINGTLSLTLKLTEGSTITNGFVFNALSVGGLNPSFC